MWNGGYKPRSAYPRSEPEYKPENVYPSLQNVEASFNYPEFSQLPSFRDTKHTLMDNLLIEYKKKVVDFKENILVENRNIADTFVTNFIQFLKEETGMKFIKFIRQGSAFENVQVFHPNEFDYLLALSVEWEEISSKDVIKNDLQRINKNKAFSEDMSVCYDTIQIPEFMKKYPEYKQFCVKWPGTKEECVSSHKMSHWYKDWLFKYWQKMENQPKIKGVKRIEQPWHHDPALTTVLVKNDGTSISVDMSVCIRLFGPDEDKLYIAKRPHTIDPYLEHRACLLWLPTRSMLERDYTLSKFEHQRDNYKIVKALLYRQELIADDNSYIIKAIFLRDDTDLLLPSESPTKYLNYFLDSLQRAYTLELKRRTVAITNEEKKRDTIQGYMNPKENVLARYRTNVIARKLHELEKLIKLRHFDPDCYRRQLMSRDLDKLPEYIIDEYDLYI